MRGSIFWKFLVITHVFEHLWPYFSCFSLKSHVFQKKILTKSKNYSENWSNFKTIPQQLLANYWKYTPLSDSQFTLPSYTQMWFFSIIRTHYAVSCVRITFGTEKIQLLAKKKVYQITNLLRLLPERRRIYIHISLLR